MKKVILTMTVLAMASAGIQTAKAGNSEWATVGKVLTGIVAVSVIAHAIHAEPACTTVYYSAPAPRYSYCPPPPPRVVYAQPVYYAPTPVVVYRAPVYYAPAPVVSYRYGYGGERHHYRHGRW